MSFLGFVPWQLSTMSAILVNTPAKQKLLICLLFVMMVTFIYLPHMARKSSRMLDLDQDSSVLPRSSRVIRHRYLPFRRRLSSPIHSRKFGQKSSRLQRMYRDTLNRLIHEAKTYREFFHKSYGILPWPMRKSERSRKKSKYLIYRCEVTSDCGGWVSRVHGIMTSYLLASLTNRTFKVEILDTPCPLTKFLVPHASNWSLSSSFHKRIIPSSHVHLMNLPANSSLFQKQNSKLNLFTLFPHSAKFVYVKSGRKSLEKLKERIVRHHKLDWMQDLNKTEINAALFKFLFKPSPLLRQHLKHFRQTTYSSQRKKLACAASSFHGDISQLLAKFTSSYANNSDYSFYITPSPLREKIVKLTKIPADRFVPTPPHLLSNLTANVYAPGMDKKSCIHVPDVFKMMVFMQCDAILVNNAHFMQLAAMVRGSNLGTVCVGKDGRSVSKRPCVS